MKIEITMTEICLLADLFCERFKISAKDATKAVPAGDCAPCTPHSTLSTPHPKEDITRVKTAADDFMEALKNSVPADDKEDGGDVPADDEEDDDEFIGDDGEALEIGDNAEFVDDCADALLRNGYTLKNATPQKICDALVAFGYDTADKNEVREALIDACAQKAGTRFSVDFKRIGRGYLFTFKRKPNE